MSSPLEALHAALRTRSGLAEDAVGRARLREILESRARAAGRVVDAEREAVRALDDAAEYEAIESCFSPSETWLFRYPESLEALRRRFAGRTAPVRVLCAGCGGLAEPVSVAIALLSAVASGCAVRVEAFDRNSEAMRAGSARFAGMQLRGGVPAYASPFLEASGECLVPSARVAGSIDARHGALHAIVPALAAAGMRYDAVFFRNVAIYLDLEARRAAFAALAALLAPEGVLLVGHSEMHAAAQATGLAPADDAAAYMLSRRAPAVSAHTQMPREGSTQASRASAQARSEAAQAKPRAAHAGPDSRQGKPDSAQHAQSPASLAADASIHAACAEDSLASGDLASAEASVTKALYLDRAHEGALLVAARLAEARGDPSAAERFRARALKAHLDAESQRGKAP